MEAQLSRSFSHLFGMVPSLDGPADFLLYQFGVGRAPVHLGLPLAVSEVMWSGCSLPPASSFSQMALLCAAHARDSVGVPLLS